MEDLTPYKLQLDLIQLTAAQLIKDFGIQGIDITFSGKSETAYDELCNQVEPIFTRFLLHDPGKLLNLLYRIDVKERSMVKAMDLPDLKSRRDALIRLVLERELQKVVIRTQGKV